MKGAKGGNRDRIISWLFSEKTRKKHEEELEKEKEEQLILDEKRKERRKKKEPKKEKKSQPEPVKPVEEIEILDIFVDDKVEEKTTDKTNKKDEDNSKEDNNDKKKNDSHDDSRDRNYDELEITLIDVFDTSRDKKPPTLFVDEEVVETIKEQSKKNSKKDEEKDDDISHIFPEVDEFDILENDIKDNIQQTELVQISIIEEINDLIRNDLYDLRDIKYRIEVLNEQEQDEVLLENVERIQKELEELKRKFEEIKKKYDDLYSFISVKDIKFINDLSLNGIISDYITEGKDGLDNSETINQLYEIEEFIDIINSIIEIEKQKDLVEDSVEAKLVDFSIRDDEFIKLQDQYARVEDINKLIDKYNSEMDHFIDNINYKIDNSLEISRRVEQTMDLVPDFNRMLHAVMLIMAAETIPPTPAGELFRTSLLVNAATMMATAVTPRFQEHLVETRNVTDYSSEIKNGMDDIKGCLYNIENAFGEINYIKDVFEKEFSDYQKDIPEYDELIKNIFAIEKELTRQRKVVYGYNDQLEQSLVVNNQKVKMLENE